jgi:hypothetical protein
MLVRAPPVEAEKDSSIRIEDLTKVIMDRSCLGLAEERLVPLAAGRHIAYADDRPRTFHDTSPVGLTPSIGAEAAGVAEPSVRCGHLVRRRSVDALVSDELRAFVEVRHRQVCTNEPVHDPRIPSSS